MKTLGWEIKDSHFDYINFLFGVKESITSHNSVIYKVFVFKNRGSTESKKFASMSNNGENKGWV